MNINQKLISGFLAVSRLILKPILKLTEAATKIGKGKLDTEIEIKSRDEVEELDRSFKEMVSKLKGKEEELRQVRGELEECSKTLKGKAGGRTEDLVQSQRATLNMLEDLTEAKETLEASKASFHDIVEKSADGIIIVDKDGFICFVNPATERLFDRRKEELLGELFGFPAVAGEKMEIDIILKAGKPGTGELRVVEANWESKPAYLVSIRDITERKEVDRLKNEFISTVSHELRTPLTTIRESVSQVLDGLLGETTEGQREFLSICLEDVDRLKRIIDNLLDISKIEAGKVEIQRKKVDVVSLIKVVVSIFYSQAKNKGLEIKTISPQEVVEIYADKDKITQVFTNLVSNSLKFTEKGHIEISVMDKQDFVECSVSDTGKGIAKEDLPKVFGKFQQFGRVSGPGEKGTGLGLSITKHIVELHNGKIWIKSELNKGTEFTFTLPKYDTEKVLYDSIASGITEAKKDHKDFSAFVFKIDNCSEIKKEFGEEKLQKIFHNILNTLKNVIKSGDFITKDKDEIILFAKISGQDMLKMSARLKKAIKEYISEIDEKLEINFSYGYSTFPDDADNAEDLLEKARKALVSEW